jgi:hypothetical protein
MWTLPIRSQLPSRRPRGLLAIPPRDILAPDARIGRRTAAASRTHKGGWIAMSRIEICRAALALAVLGMVASASGRAEAGFTFTMQERTLYDDVIVTGSGYFHPGALPPPSATGPFSAGIDPSVGFLSVGGVGDVFLTKVATPDYIGPILGPKSFGSGGFVSASAVSGDPVGIEVTGGHPSPGFVALPEGYFPFGKDLSDTIFFEGQTYASLGVTPGVYTWGIQTAHGDPIDTITLNIVKGASPVPEPGSALLLGAGLLGLAALSYRPYRRGVT